MNRREAMKMTALAVVPPVGGVAALTAIHPPEENPIDWRKEYEDLYCAVWGVTEPCLDEPGIREELDRTVKRAKAGHECLAMTPKGQTFHSGDRVRLTHNWAWKLAGDEAIVVGSYAQVCSSHDPAQKTIRQYCLRFMSGETLSWCSEDDLEAV